MRRLVPPVLVLSVAVAVPGVADRLPALLAEVEAFRVQRVTIEGTHYLSRDEVQAVLAIPPGASVWDDVAPWERVVASHPLVRSVEIRRRLPSTLVVRVEERVPVGFVATPTLEPVDIDGRTVPVDPAVHPVDLPLLRVPHGTTPGPERLEEEARPASATPAGGGSGTPPSASPGGPTLRVLAAEVARLAEEEPSFSALLSELGWVGPGEVVARWGEPPIDLRFRPPLSVAGVRRAMVVVADASARWADRRVVSLDLRFADQAVVSYAGGGL